jgi:hypothetical protein
MSTLEAALLDAALLAYALTGGWTASWAANTMGEIPMSAKVRMCFTDFE